MCIRDRIMDDAPVDKDTRNAIIEVGFRGRHYGVSLWILAISFVMAPKPLRRSLDCLIILSGLPLQSDRKALTEDFCGGAPQHALWALENLKTHQALVCLLTKGRFNMYVYRARNITGPLGKNDDPWLEHVKKVRAQKKNAKKSYKEVLQIAKLTYKRKYSHTKIAGEETEAELQENEDNY